MGAPGHPLQGSSSCKGTALASVGDGGGSEGTNDGRDGVAYAGKMGLQLLLSSNAEASQNARRPSSSLVRDKARVMLRSPKTDGAPACG